MQSGLGEPLWLVVLLVFLLDERYRQTFFSFFFASIQLPEHRSNNTPKKKMKIKKVRIAPRIVLKVESSSDLNGNGDLSSLTTNLKIQNGVYTARKIITAKNISLTLSLLR